MTTRPVIRHHFSDGLIANLAQQFGDVELVDAQNCDLSQPAFGLLTTGRPRDDLAAALETTTDWVHLISTGIEHFPIELVPSHLTLTCSRGASAVPISEWVLTTMLMFEKQLPAMWIDQAPEKWHADPHLGGLAGKTVAVIGYGEIGRRVATLAHAFDMRVVATRRRPVSADDAAASFATVVPDTTTAVSDADHIVLGAPLTPETAQMIDEGVFAAMKPGTHLVNIARGGLVDQDALRNALDSGVVARASLDTVDPEPLPDGHWLYTHPQVRLSRHISWSGHLGWTAHGEIIAHNIEAMVNNTEPIGLVDRPAGY